MRNIIDLSLVILLIVAVIFYIGYSIAKIQNQKKKIASLEEYAFQLSRNSLQRFSLPTDFFQSMFLKVDTSDISTQDFYTKLDFQAINILYYIGDFHCNTCFDDIRFYLNNSSEKI